MIPFTLAGGGVVLEPPVDADIDPIAEYCADPLFEHWMTTPWPYTRRHAEGFVNSVAPGGWHNGLELTWAIRSTTGGPLLGVIGLRRRDAHTMDVGYWMGAPHRGGGRMSAALDLVTAWAFSPEGGDLDTLLWECVAGNHASMAVARAAGYTFTGAGPSHQPGRAGDHLPSWHGMLHRDDSGERTGGWPL